MRFIALEKWVRGSRAADAQRGWAATQIWSARFIALKQEIVYNARRNCVVVGAGSSRP